MYELLVFHPKESLHVLPSVLIQYVSNPFGKVVQSVYSKDLQAKVPSEQFTHWLPVFSFKYFPSGQAKH